MRVNSIQFLRAVAVLLVVYAHSMNLEIQFGTSKQQRFYNIANFACIGVDLFFIISGFIIMYIANKYKGNKDGMRFFEKRFIRINPIYYIVTILALGVLLIQLYVTNNNLSQYSHKIINGLIDSLTIIPLSWNIKQFSPILIVGWTLSFEWLFYILFGILIFTKVTNKALILSFIVISLVSIGQIVNPKDLRLQFICNPILLEFIIGIIICQFYMLNKYKPAWLGGTLLSFGLICYVLLIRFGFGNLWFYEYTVTGKLSLLRAIFWGIPSGSIVCGCLILQKKEFFRKIFNNPLAILIGNASYSIYLIHYPFFNILKLIYLKTNFFLQGDVMICLQVVLAVIVSVSFYKLIENPLLKYFNNKYMKPNGTIQSSSNINYDTKELVSTHL